MSLADGVTAPRALVRDVFLRLLGLVFLVAFLSALSQLELLVGEKGLLPAGEFLARARAEASPLLLPTVFWLHCGDAALVAVAVAGAIASVGLVLGFAPRLCLAAAWALYLSLATVGQDFFQFQWDTLLLESAFCAFFVTPGGLRPRRETTPPPHPIGVFLMLWLVFRLHAESGGAKLLSGDPTWRDLTAMRTYYETAPLPTWIGWWAHQLPLWAHEATSAATLVVEIAFAPLVFLPWRRVRLVAFVSMVALQAGVALTANYGFFNWLSAALCLWVLDDGHFPRVATRPAAEKSPRRTFALALVALLVVPLSVVPFLGFLNPSGRAIRSVWPIARTLQAYRSINAYHLFASMTIDRYEVVIEGSEDGRTWLPYEWRHKPGDPARAPGFVAPHQPRADFQAWFLMIRGRQPREPWFAALLERMEKEPGTVSALFSADPFAGRPPKELRVRAYRYRFTDRATRRATGAYWNREPVRFEQVVRQPRPQNPR